MNCKIVVVHSSWDCVVPLLKRIHARILVLKCIRYGSLEKCSRSICYSVMFLVNVSEKRWRKFIFYGKIVFCDEAHFYTLLSKITTGIWSEIQKLPNKCVSKNPYFFNKTTILTTPRYWL